MEPSKEFTRGDKVRIVQLPFDTGVNYNYGLNVPRYDVIYTVEGLSKLVEGCYMISHYDGLRTNLQRAMWYELEKVTKRKRKC
jgi:hypothetical protein